MSSASEKEFLGIWGDFFCCSTPSKKGGVSIHKNAFASCQLVSSQGQSRALTCPFKQSNLSAWSLLS